MEVKDGTIFATGVECVLMNHLPFWVRLKIGLRLIFARMPAHEYDAHGVA